MNEQLKGFLTSFGVIAETTKALYDSFIKVGFDSEKALYLACEMSKELLRLGTQQKKPDED